MEKEIINQLLQMNLIGIYGIGLAFLLRPLLRKAGSRYCYYLWIIVFLNLVAPTVLTGSFSLIPKQLYQVELSGLSQEQETEAASVYDENTYNGLTSGDYASLRNGAVDQLVDEASDASSDITEPAGTMKLSERVWNQAISIFGGEEAFARCVLIVWASVVAFLFAAEGAQYLKMRRRLNELTLAEKDEEKRVVTLRGLDTPLLFGFLNPMIYLPDSLNVEERTYIICHELYHRRRRDNIVKAVALCITFVYWYNPLVWLAIHFLGVDMELSCDEAVLLKSDTDIKKAYAGSLLKYGALQNHYILTSLTFGEPGLKARVKNVLRFQKRGVAITVAAVLAVALLAVGLLVRPSGSEETAETLSGEEGNRLEASDDTDENIDAEADPLTHIAEQALAQADGEALTVETLIELLNGGYSILTGFDYANCENAMLNYPEDTGTLNYWYEFSLEYEGAGYTFRASYYKSDDSLSMLYISDDAGTEDIFSLYHTNEGSAYYLAAPENFEAYLLETQDRTSWNVEIFLSSIGLPEGYTLGSWDGSVGSLGADIGLGGGAVIEPVAYELYGGDEVTRFVTDTWQYYSGFFSRIEEGFWSWEGDTLAPGNLPLGNHMESSFVEMVDGTAKTAYLLEVEYDLYTASGEAQLEESGLDLNEIDLVSEYWYIIFVDDGVGADTGYCLGLAKNQFTKEEATEIARSVVFAE